MKKLLAVSIVLALLAPLALFAQAEDDDVPQITFGGWGRANFEPLRITGPGHLFNTPGHEHEVLNDDGITWRNANPTDAEYSMGLGKSWGFGGNNVDNTPHIRLDISGKSKYIGFDIQFVASENYNLTLARIQENDFVSILQDTLGARDFTDIWVKPLGNDILKLYFGWFNEDELRGKIGDVNGFAYATLPSDAEDAIFTRFRGNGGFHAALTPIENLYIGFLLPTINIPDGGWDHDGNWADNLENSQIGAGFKIPGIGYIRAQFINHPVVIDWTPATLVNRAMTRETTDTHNGVAVNVLANQASDTAYNSLPLNRTVLTAWTNKTIEAAFQLTALENLTLDLGVKIPLTLTEKFDYDVAGFRYRSASFDNREGTAPAYTNWAHVTEEWKLNKPFRASLGADYKLGALDIWGRVDTYFYFVASEYNYSGAYTPYGSNTTYTYVQDLTYTQLPEVNIHLNPSYALDIGTIGLNLGFGLKGKDRVEYTLTDTQSDPTDTDVNTIKYTHDGDTGVSFAAGAYFQKNFAGGTFQIGLAWRADTKEVDAATGKSTWTGGHFSIPIVVDYAF